MSTSKATSDTALHRGDLVVIDGDARGIARLDRWLAASDDDKAALTPAKEDASTHARVFFFATGLFEVVPRTSVVAAPVGAGAPAHADMMETKEHDS